MPTRMILRLRKRQWATKNFAFADKAALFLRSLATGLTRRFFVRQRSPQVFVKFFSQKLKKDHDFLRPIVDDLRTTLG